MNTDHVKQLVQAATKARLNAHASYSGFQVGAALYTFSGLVFTGCNVENQSYGLTICAERNAIFHAVAEGHRHFSVMAVVADTEEPVLPCGACRQVMAEFNPDLRLILANLKGNVVEYSLADLFPNPFRLD
ncbi:cytidine deaminase [bacterium]|nr:cytidine deaminase [bacterium]